MYKTIFLSLLLFITFLAFLPGVIAADVYVDNSCQTSGDGTTTTCGVSGPFNDLHAAIASLQGGDTLYIMQGTGVYATTDTGTGAFAPTNIIGTQNAWTRITTYPGADPLITNCGLNSDTVYCDHPTFWAVGNRYLIFDGLRVQGSIRVRNSLAGDLPGLAIINSDISVGWESPNEGNWATIWLQGIRDVYVANNTLHSLQIPPGGGTHTSATYLMMVTVQDGIFEYNNLLTQLTPHGQGGPFDKGQVNGFTYRRNYIQNVNTGYQMGGQEYGYITIGNTHFTENLVDCSDGTHNCGMNVGNRGENRSVTHNTIINANGAVISAHGTNFDRKYYNNLFDNTRQRNMEFYSADVAWGVSATDIANYNIYTPGTPYDVWGEGGQRYFSSIGQYHGYGYEPQTQELDCQLDANYHIPPGSPCENFGRTGGVSAGTPVDPGAFAFTDCVGRDCPNPEWSRTDLFVTSSTPTAPEPFFEWDPNDYATTQQLLAANTNPTTTIVSLATNQVLHDGSIGNVMRQTYPGDGTEGDANYDLVLPGAADGVTDEIWIEFYMRFDENWNYATDDKTFFVMPNTQLGRWELHYGAWGTRVYGGPSTSPNDFFIVSDDDRIDVATDVWGGDWHRTRLYLRMSSSTGASDGAFYWWIDDTPLITDTVAALYGAGVGEGISTGNSAGQYFGSFRLSANADPEPSGIRDWGPLRVWTEDPGWTFNGEPQADCVNGATRACGSDVGACVAGTQMCSGGSWGDCVGAVGPSLEVCDGLDNDCDGVVDEGGVCPVDPDPEYPVVSVSSSYTGYSSEVINDGIIDAHGGTSTTWASADNGGPHWVEFDFGEDVSLSEFTVHWGYNTASSSFMTSQEVRIQVWDGSWQTVGTFARIVDETSSTISFTPNTAQRWRILQPINEGPVSYNAVMWLTEIDYALSAGSDLLGDRNGDGIVNIQDILIIIQNFRRATFDARADVNGDGVVNVFDLVLVARDFGRSIDFFLPVSDNMPSGMTIIYDTNFTASGFTQLSPPRLASTQHSGPFLYSSSWDQGDVIAYPEQSFLRYSYPVGFVAGGSPGRAVLENQPNAYDQLYMQFRIRYNNWQNHPSSVNKLMYWDMDGGASVGHHYINMDGSRMAGRSQYAQAYAPYTDGQRLYPWDWHSTHPTYYIAETPVNDGEWHTVEVLATRNTLFEHPVDGEIQMWVDGVLQFNITDVRWNASGSAAFRGFRLDPVWGGVNTLVSAEGMSLDFDRVLFAGKNLDEPSEPTCSPSPEICDGIDNDCDGLIDEGGVCAEATIFVQESFDDTNFASRGWYDGGATSAVITSSEAISGNSLELRYNQGDTIPVGGYAMRHLFEESDSVYVSYWVKYSDNWVGSNRAYHPHEMQIVTNVDSMWLGPAYSHLTAYIEHNNGFPLLAIQDARNVDDTQIGTNLVSVTENRAVAGCNGNGDGYDDDCYYTGSQWRNGKTFRADQVYFSDSPGPYYKGEWHFIESYFQLNSIENGIGQPDGVVQYWYDGEPVIDLHDVYLRTGQHPNMQFNQFLLAHYIGDGSPVGQTLWIDNLTIADRRP